MFGRQTGLYVIRNDTEIMKDEKAYSTLEGDIRDNYIVLLYEKLDSRLKFGKHFKDNTVLFEKLAPNVLVSYIRKKCPLSAKNAEKLSNTCNGSYDVSMLEADKVNQYSRGGDADAAFEKLLSDGTIYQPEETNTFAWVEAAMNRNVNESLRIYSMLVQAGTQPIMMLGTLYNAVRATYLIKLCKGHDVANITGLDKGSIYYNRKYVNNFSLAELNSLLKLIAHVVEGIKNGTVEEDISVNYVMVNMF
jgi:DNA polymerase III delta subunit